MFHRLTSPQSVRPSIGLAITLLLSMMLGTGMGDVAGVAAESPSNTAAKPLPKKWVYPCVVDNTLGRDPITDGDTFRVIVDLGFRLQVSYAVRLNGIDTPERSTLAGRYVREVTRHWIALQNKLLVRSVAADKYEGRFVGVVYGDDGESLSDYLLENGLAKPYDGGRKLAWSGSELAKVVERAKALLATNGK